MPEAALDSDFKICGDTKATAAVLSELRNVLDGGDPVTIEGAAIVT